MNQFSTRSLQRLPFDAPEPPKVREADLDLTSIVRLLLRRARLISATIVILTMIALPFVMAIEPVYHARANFLLHPVLTIGPTVDTEPLDMAAEVERIRSRPIAEKIIAQFDLADNPTFNPDLKPIGLLNGMFPRKASVSGPPELVDGRRQQPILGAYFARLSAWHEASQLIQVGFTAPDPQLAADVPNAIIKHYTADREEKNRARINAALASMDQQILIQAETVKRSSAAINAFRKESGVTSAGRGAELDSNRVALLNEQIADVRRQRTELAALIATAEAALINDAAVAVEEPENLIELRQLLQLRKSALNRLQANHGDAYGGIQVEKANIEELQRTVASELASWIDSMRVQSRQLDFEEQALSQVRAKDEQVLARTSMAESELTTLIRDADAQRDILALLEGQRRQLEARLLQPSVEVEILSPSILPTIPEGRSRKTYLLFAVIASFLVALTLAGILEALDEKVRSDQQLEGTASLVPLGKLPRKISMFKSKNHQRALRIGWDTVLLNLKAASHGTFPDSLAITSVRPQDEMAKVAYQLAAEIAASGQDVLLIDTQNRVSRGPSNGFSEYLHQYKRAFKAPDLLLDELIFATRVPHLYSLGACEGPLSSLHDDRPLTQLLNYAKARNLMAIFVCPAVFETAMTSRICGVVQGTVLALRWGHTPRALVPLAVERLRLGPASPLLTILHDVNLRLYALYPFRDAALFSRPMRNAV